MHFHKEERVIILTKGSNTNTKNNHLKLAMIDYLFNDKTVACQSNFFQPPSQPACVKLVCNNTMGVTTLMGLIAQVNDLSTCSPPNSFLS